MGDFFHGWRRKTGCVALVMACLFAGMRMRSYLVYDRGWFPLGARQHALISMRGGISWCAWNSNSKTVNWSSNEFNRWGGSGTIYWYDQIVRPPYPDFPALGEWTFDYWWLVLPLTILSAYLILWKP